MEKISYCCDVGSVAVNCGGSIIRINNCEGDCSSNIYIMDSTQEFEEYVEAHKKYYHRNDNSYDEMTYQLSCDFKDAVVLYYDCPDEHDDCKTNIVLNGHYNIYAWSGKVYFVPYKTFAEEAAESKSEYEHINSQGE